MNFMIEITKLMISMSATGYQKQKNKDKSITTLLVKLSEFRYISRYLSTEVMNIKQRKNSCDNFKTNFNGRLTETSNNMF